jgi:hypothetical protein
MAMVMDTDGDDEGDSDGKRDGDRDGGGRWIIFLGVLPYLVRVLVEKLKLLGTLPS